MTVHQPYKYMQTKSSCKLWLLTKFCQHYSLTHTPHRFTDVCNAERMFKRKVYHTLKIFNTFHTTASTTAVWQQHNVSNSIKLKFSRLVIPNNTLSVVSFQQNPLKCIYRPSISHQIRHLEYFAGNMFRGIVGKN